MKESQFESVVQSTKTPRYKDASFRSSDVFQEQRTRNAHNSTMATSILMSPGTEAAMFSPAPKSGGADDSIFLPEPDQCPERPNHSQLNFKNYKNYQKTHAFDFNPEELMQVKEIFPEFKQPSNINKNKIVGVAVDDLK